MKRFASLVARMIATIALLVSFFLIWSGLRVSRAVAQGALEQPAFCFDARDLQREVSGTVDQRSVDGVLVRQIGAHFHTGRELSLQHHFRMASYQIGLTLFWSDKRRRDYYDRVALKMRPCSSALKRLADKDELSPEVIEFATQRLEQHGLPMPKFDRLRGNTRSAHTAQSPAAPPPAQPRSP